MGVMTLVHFLTYGQDAGISCLELTSLRQNVSIANMTY